jgi:hypothetical protein
MTARGRRWSPTASRRSPPSSTSRAKAACSSRRLSLDCEVSVVLARDEAGGMQSFPTAENSHRKGILDVSLVPARAAAALHERAAGLAGDDRRTPGLHRHAGGRVLRRRRRTGDQRNGAAAAQQRSLHARRLHHQPVRTAGARTLRPAARRPARAFGRGDGQPARRPVVRKRPPASATASPTGRSCTPARASSCISTASTTPGPAARWGTSPCSMRPEQCPRIAMAARAAIGIGDAA